MREPNSPFVMHFTGDVNQMPADSQVTFLACVCFLQAAHEGLAQITMLANCMLAPLQSSEM